MGSQVSFQVLGDGVVLKKCKLMNQRGPVLMRVPIDGVKVLELAIKIPGKVSNTHCHTVWLEPRILAEDTAGKCDYIVFAIVF